jgi:hypothetical protein
MRARNINLATIFEFKILEYSIIHLSKVSKSKLNNIKILNDLISMSSEVIGAVRLVFKRYKTFCRILPLYKSSSLVFT